MSTFVNNFTQINNGFECVKCGFSCAYKRDYERHISTRKHLNLMNFNTFSTHLVPKSPNAKIFACDNCEKVFKERTGLWKHTKKNNCQIVNNQLDNKEYLGGESALAQMFMEIMKQNKELQSQLFEMSKEKTCITNNYNNNNTMNNKFNLQIFLNETCKDAMNIQEFIDYVKVQHSDFENFGKYGYVEALTRIFLRNLMELDVCRRPIHCSDSKREVLYVKDNDVWVSDVTREKLIRTIKYIANKNVKQIPGWMDKNPDSKNTQTKLHDKYMRMLCFSMGAKTVEEDQEYYKKIIRNVAKEVCIDKAR